MIRLRNRRYFTVGMLALILGGALTAAAIQQGISPRVAIVSGATTTTLAIAIAVIASQFYGHWFPELNHFSETERRAALHAATPYALLLFYVVVFVPLTWLTIPILKWLQAYGGVPALVLGLVTAWTTPVLLAVWVVRQPIRRGLRRELAAKGLPICIQCGYNTRGLAEPICPECGHALSV